MLNLYNLIIHKAMTKEEEEMYKEWAEDRLAAEREADNYFRVRDLYDAHMEYLMHKASLPRSFDEPLDDIWS